MNNKNTKKTTVAEAERNTVLVGDVRTRLTELPEDSVDCIVTSPPYFRLRNYGEEEQIGLEDHVDGWVQEMRGVFTDLSRVLKSTGSVWLNLGDSYSRDQKAGAPPKGLLLAPERLLLALAGDGWIIRNKVIWAKTNPMPNAVKDRLSCTYENVYFLTREASYFFDLDAIRIPHRTAKTPTVRKSSSYPPPDAGAPEWAGPLAGNNSGLSAMKRAGLAGHPLGKNPGDVWRFATANFRGAHFATFPRALVERPLLATCPERICIDCGKPWERQRTKKLRRQLGHLAVHGELRPTCRCEAPHRPGLALDPFFGAGTTGLVAEALGREWVGIELNAEFAAMATTRITQARADRARSCSRPVSGDEQQPTKRAA